MMLFSWEACFSFSNIPFLWLGDQCFPTLWICFKESLQISDTSAKYEGKYTELEVRTRAKCHHSSSNVLGLSSRFMESQFNPLILCFFNYRKSLFVSWRLDTNKWCYKCDWICVLKFWMKWKLYGLMHLLFVELFH